MFEVVIEVINFIFLKCKKKFPAQWSIKTPFFVMFIKLSHLLHNSVPDILNKFVTKQYIFSTSLK